MKNADYPALYQSADSLSLESQQKFFRALFWHLTFLVIAAIISVVNSSAPKAAIFQALVLLGALSCAVYLFFVRPERDWYGARAVAESIKTITWRFVSKAEPFEGAEDVAHSHFQGVLRNILEQNKHIAQRQLVNLEGAQISPTMTALRRRDFAFRRDEYIKARISEQQLWYAKKASNNKRIVTLFLVALITTNFLAMTFAITKVAFPDAPFWPTDALVALAASLLAWIQAKRFQEHSASYALAAHEISLIREQAVQVSSDETLSQFVANSENAFSREHTQWIARKDN